MSASSGQDVSPPRLTDSSVLKRCFPPLPSPAFIGSPGEWDLSVIPQGGEPRWMILGDPRRALPVLRSWQPYKLKSRLQWKSVQFAAALGALPRLPGVRSARVPLDLSYWRQHLPETPALTSLVLLVGNPSHTRKAILFISGERPGVQAVGKVPLTDAARAAILDEAAILAHLRGKGIVPGLLFSDAAHGIAAQTWLEGSPVSRKLTSAHIDLLASLAEDSTTVCLAGFHEELATAASKAPDLPLDASLLARALSLLESTEPLPAFVEHRDFAPWNLKRLSGGHLTLIDWEWAVRNSLPFQDLCRYFYIQDYLFHESGDVWRTLRGDPLVQSYLRRFDIPPQLLAGLATYYLLRMLCLDWALQNTASALYHATQIRRVLDGVL